MEKQPIYIVAVSGGVDSVVMLHKSILRGGAKLVVAHFDHGIRADSADDRKFVQGLAEQYGLAFEYAEGKLGPSAPEAAARRARYDFLKKVKQKYRADAIVTAHHQDDVIETAIINILRGTKRRGLSSLKSGADLIRPLLDETKLSILNFATKHKLKWREDPTNLDTSYLRNYVRQVLLPKLDAADPTWRKRFLAKLKKGGQLNQEIDNLLDEVDRHASVRSDGSIRINQVRFISLPGEIGRELMRRWLEAAGLGERLGQPLIRRAWLFAKTARRGARLDLGRRAVLSRKGRNVLVTAKTSG